MKAELRITHHAVGQILTTIGRHPPETGGILLGPIGSMDVTDFYFDQGAACTAGTYTPDHVSLRRKMHDEWLPAGLDMKGFAHSHPRGFDRLSSDNLQYIGRLLEKNTDLAWFAAPIVIPHEFRLRAWIVPRQRPDLMVEAQLVFI